MPDFLGDHTFLTVLIGTGVIGAVSGALGCFAYLRRQSLVGDVVSHSALLGIVLAFLASSWFTGTGSKSVVVIIPGAILAGTAALLLARLITQNTRIKEDCGLGVMLAIFFGTGVLLLRWVQREPVVPGHSGLEDYLFGLAAALTQDDLRMIGVLGILAIGTLLLLWKQFKLYTFDPAFAHSLGLRTHRLDTVLLTLLVIGIVIGIHAVGVVLMIALLVTPATAARQWARSLGQMVLLSGCFGALAGGIGSLVSATVKDMPTGPVIVLAATAIFVVSLLAAPRRGLIARALRRNRQLAAVGREAGPGGAA